MFREPTRYDSEYWPSLYQYEPQLYRGVTPELMSEEVVLEMARCFGTWARAWFTSKGADTVNLKVVWKKQEVNEEQHDEVDIWEDAEDGFLALFG